MLTAKNSQDWCVVYRTGGTENFQWHRTEAMSREAADGACESVKRGGRRAIVVRYSQSMSIGLPSTWSANPDETREDKRAELEQWDKAMGHGQTDEY